MDYKKLPNRCGVENCKTRLFYMEDGHWFCKYGHRREGEVELADEDEMIRKGTRHRRPEKEKEAKEKRWHGKKGHELYLQCRQLVMRKQVKWLVEEKGLPAELENIVKDLWALRLEKLLNKVLHPALGGSFSENESQSESGFSSAHSSQYTTQSSGAEWTEDEGRPKRQRRGGRQPKKPLPEQQLKKRKRRVYGGVPIVDTIGTCYLGCLMLRAAVSVGDFHRWIESQELLYYNAMKAIPKNMAEKLNASYFPSFNPSTELKASELHHAIHILAFTYTATFNIHFPPINAAGLLIRYMVELGAPPEIYPAARKLAEILSIDYEYRPLEKFKIYRAETPEAQLMATTLLALKLAYGIGEGKRTPLYPHEIGAIQIDMDRYCDFLQEFVNRGREGRVDGEVGFKITEKDALDMSAEDMDRYLDWYEKKWLLDANTNVHSQILDLFPIETSSPAVNRQTDEDSPSLHPDRASEVETLFDKVANVNRGIKLLPAEPDAKNLKDKVMRPGERYLHYYQPADIPQNLNLLLEAGAKIIGVDMAVLRSALGRLEWKLYEYSTVIRRDRRDREREDEDD